MRSLLIVKIAAIGDVVMALPIASWVRQQYPVALITWVCGRAAAPILRLCNEIDEVIEVDETALLRGRVTERIREVLRLWLKLAGRRYDLVVTGHSDPRYLILSAPVISKKRRAFTWKHRNRIPGRFHSDEYLRLVTGIDGPDAPTALLPTLRCPLREELGSRLLSEGRPLVALAPGGARNVLSDDPVRRWPVENYVELARLLVKEGVRVVLTGGATDTWACSAFKNVESIVDLIGHTSVTDLLAVYRVSNVVVTHDSGSLHLAILAGTRIVALFGPTDPRERVPRSDKVRVVWGGRDLACRPCYNGRSYAKCARNLCMLSISPTEVAEIVLAMVAASASNTGTAQPILDAARTVE
jgi:heptosyltransferase-2